MLAAEQRGRVRRTKDRDVAVAAKPDLPARLGHDAHDRIAQPVLLVHPPQEAPVAIDQHHARLAARDQQPAPGEQPGREDPLAAQPGVHLRRIRAHRAVGRDPRQAAIGCAGDQAAGGRVGEQHRHAVLAEKGRVAERDERVADDTRQRHATSVRVDVRAHAVDQDARRARQFPDVEAPIAPPEDPVLRGEIDGVIGRHRAPDVTEVAMLRRQLRTQGYEAFSAVGQHLEVAQLVDAAGVDASVRPEREAAHEAGRGDGDGAPFLAVEFEHAALVAEVEKTRAIGHDGPVLVVFAVVAKRVVAPDEPAGFVSGRGADGFVRGPSAGEREAKADGGDARENHGARAELKSAPGASVADEIREAWPLRAGAPLIQTADWWLDPLGLMV